VEGEGGGQRDERGVDRGSRGGYEGTTARRRETKVELWGGGKHTAAEVIWWRWVFGEVLGEV
jgi:hypothetical protein